MISVKALSSRLLFLVLLTLVFNNISFAEEAVFKKTFENGLVCLVKESPPKDLVSIDVTVKASPLYEEEYLGS